MEDKEIGKDAIESSRRWLNSARINASAGSYDAALYSLEMSVEIALKALLLSLGIEVPRTHSIGDLVIESVRDNKRLPKELAQNVDKIVGLFNSLAALRPISGYIFETKSSLKDLKVKYDKYADEAEAVIEMCGRAVKSAGR